jgi:mevalonate kinase
MPTVRSEPLTAFGPGKVILLGEHSVVYGHPALAGALSVGMKARGVPARRCQLVLPPELSSPQRALLKRAFARAAEATGAPAVKVTLEAQLPVSMGLGSSAALSVACARLLLQAAGGGRAPVPAEVARVAWGMEQEFHGTPSGVDHTTSALGQLVLFRKRPGLDAGRARVLASPRPLRVVVALAGVRSPTKTTVASLRARQARWPQRYTRLFREMGRLATEGAEAVEAGDLEALGDLMNVNQGLLSALGLSSPALEASVHRLRALGALGAKLTGAGGDGGAVIGLFPQPDAALAQLKRDGVRCFASQLAGPAEP